MQEAASPEVCPITSMALTNSQRKGIISLLQGIDAYRLSKNDPVLLDSMARVCCALHNTCDAVVAITNKLHRTIYSNYGYTSMCSSTENSIRCIHNTQRYISEKNTNSGSIGYI